MRHGERDAGPLLVVVTLGLLLLGLSTFRMSAANLPRRQSDDVAVQVAVNREERRQLWAQLEAYVRRSEEKEGEEDNEEKEEEMKEGHATPQPLPKRKRKKPKHKIAIASSLKQCAPEEEICKKQWNAVRSWTLCLEAHVFLFGDFQDDDAQQEFLSELPPQRVTVVNSFGKSPSGVPLLSSIVAYLADTRDGFDAFMFVNADIIFVPYQLSAAVQMLRNAFEEYFAVGRRTTVSVAERLPFSSSSSTWLKQLARLYKSAPNDRIDAEDYFLWSRGFFSPAELKAFPDFRIGRPAFDNWFVHKAVVSGKPVVDITNSLLALHQRHGYAHIKGGKSNKYWATQDQEENYRLGKDHGGWRYGLIEFAPWTTLPEGCAAKNLTAVIDGGEEGGGDHLQCAVSWNPSWKPLPELGATVQDTKARYAPYRKRNPKKTKAQK